MSDPSGPTAYPDPALPPAISGISAGMPDKGDARQMADAERSRAIEAETALMHSVAAGDAAAAERLVREHSPRMLAVARRMFRHEQDADDAVQDAFISVFRHAASFAGNSRLTTWLHRVTVNACLMRLRSADKSTTSIDELLPTFVEDGHHRRRPQEWRDEAINRLTLEETRAAVRKCIDLLPDAYRQVVLLRDIEGLDTEETAKALATTAGNVKTRLHRARLALRELLERSAIGP